MGAALPAGGGGGGRRGGRRRRHSSAPMAEINVTPFVDVMLVLLIIFMVAAPLLTAGVPIKLPETAAQSMPREKKKPVSVSVDVEGRVFLDEEEVPLEALPERLASVIENPKEERVYVRADASVGYGEVMRVMGQLSSSGYGNIGLVTERRQGGAAPVGAALGGAAQ